MRDVVLEKVNKTIDNIDEKKSTLDSERKKNDVEKEIKLEIIESEREQLNHRFQEIDKISNKKHQLQELIRLHDEIKTKRGVK